MVGVSGLAVVRLYYGCIVIIIILDDKGNKKHRPVKQNSITLMRHTKS